MNTGTSSSVTFAQTTSISGLCSSTSPIPAGAVKRPTAPIPTARSSSSAACSGRCIGAIAHQKNVSGSFSHQRASSSLQVFAYSTPKSPAQYRY